VTLKLLTEINTDRTKFGDADRHEELKFHNIVAKKTMNFDSDEESTFKDPEEAAMKDHSKNEKTLLKDILIEPGTCYREQFAEILQGFPKVKKALNLNESVSMWHDSQGMSGSILENDE
jgi:hypothetical protein